MKKIFTLLIVFSALSLQAQNCWPATAQTEININNISAGLLNGGDMWWDGVQTGAYQFPKVDTSTGALARNLIFAGALWMSGLDANGELKCAAQTYRGQGHEFWPGPLTFNQNTIPDTTCTNFDRFFPILRTELNAHIGMVNLATGPLSTSSIAANILQWPAKGNQYLASNYSMTILEDLAPFHDTNGNGTYEPELGDYPLMKGDQSIFWVINDLGNTHVRSNGAPLGVEIQCMAYAYITSDAVNNATFYDYKVIKKTQGTLSDYYFSQYVDPDLGGYSDDFIGCDTILNYSFCYNADNDDDDYGAGPPIVITQFLNTPNNIGMSSFSYLINSSTIPYGEPAGAPEFRNFQTGFWSDGSPITCGGNGIGGVIPTKYVYPGNPVDGTSYTGSCDDWSECSAATNPDDRRYQMSSGPYSLDVTTPLEFTIAVMVVETDSNTYSGCPDKETLINPVVNLVDSFIENVDDSPYTVNPISSIVDFEDKNNEVLIYPNPARDFISLEVSEHLQIETIEIYDVLGSKVDVVLEGNRIDVRLLSKGVYSLKVSNAEQNKVIVKKFLVD